MTLRRALAALLLAVLTLSPLHAATSLTVMPTPFQVAQDGNGKPINNAKICTYVAGTTTPIATYTDVTGATPNPNPIRADSAGRFTAWLIPGTSYKFVYQDASGTASTCDGVTYQTIDNVSAIPGSAGAVDVTGTAGEALTAGQAVYLSAGDGGKTAGLWYKADSANTYSSTAHVVGLVPSSIAINISGSIRISGSVAGLSSLSVGANYFVGTAGALTSTAPTNARFVGQADTATSLVVDKLVTNLTVPQGGTGVTLLTAHTLLLGNGTSPVAGVAGLGTAGQVLTSLGAGLDPTWQSINLDRQVALQTVVNTVTETAVYTFAVPGGTLGTTKTLHLSLIGDQLNNSGGAFTHTVRVKYGATTVFSAVVTAIPAGANRGALLLDVELTAANATGAQRVKTWLAMGDTNSNNTAGVALSVASGSSNGSWLYANHVTVAEDSTASKNLVVTFQMNNANASEDMRAQTVYTEVK